MGARLGAASCDETRKTRDGSRMDLGMDLARKTQDGSREANQRSYSDPTAIRWCPDSTGQTGIACRDGSLMDRMYSRSRSREISREILASSMRCVESLASMPCIG